LTIAEWNSFYRTICSTFHSTKTKH